MELTDFAFGTTTRIGHCCGKPLGCDIPSAGCLWKRQKADTITCRATAVSDDPVTGERSIITCDQTGPHQTHSPVITPTGCDFHGNRLPTGGNETK